MNTILRKTIIFTLLLLFPFNIFGEDGRSEGTGNRRHGPPPEAYIACEGKSAGDTSQFVSPCGDTVTGTCEQEISRLVLRPDRIKGRSGSSGHGAPPEAYTACESKNVGDTAQFVSPHGETVTGTCEQKGDRLVLRPDRFRGKVLGQENE